MSKRGYRANSRYNPNKISSYTIRAVRHLHAEGLIDFFPGFYDSKRRISRLTRIRASEVLREHFNKIRKIPGWKVNHLKREYLLISNKNKELIEYSDNFKTHEIRDIIVCYNDLILKTFFDIPSIEKKFIIRGDNRRVAIADTNSTTDYIFTEAINSSGEFKGSWWNKLDIHSINNFKRHFIINHEKTNHIDLLDFFSIFLSQKFETKINLDLNPNYKGLNVDQKIHLILKGLHSSKADSFYRSINNDKRKIGMDFEILGSNSKDFIDRFIKTNYSISKFFFKGYFVDWSKFVSNVFFELIKQLASAKIPVYLIKEKIFYQSIMEKIVLDKINVILEKALNLKKINIQSQPCYAYDFGDKSFFGRLILSKNKFSARYLKRRQSFNSI